MKKEVETKKGASVLNEGNFEKKPRYRKRKMSGKKKNNKKEKGIYFFAW